MKVASIKGNERSTILDKICVDFLKCRDFQPPSPQNQCWAGLFAFRMNTGCNIETGGGVSCFSYKKDKKFDKKVLFKKSLQIYVQDCRRNKMADVYTTVSRLDPVEFDKFWSVYSNKVSLQQLFIYWLKNRYNVSSIVYLGGSYKEDDLSCILVSNASAKEKVLMKKRMAEYSFT